MKEKKPLWKRILKFIGILLLVCVLAIGGLMAAIVITEYNPDDEEPIAVEGTGGSTVAVGDTIKVLSWNIGYCGLGAEEDFFMDGGQEVFPSSKEAVVKNLEAIEAYLQNEAPDVVFLQEVDQNATRTSYLDEVASIRSVMKNYASTFANNFKCCLSLIQSLRWDMRTPAF